MDIARPNFSHDDRAVRNAADEAGRTVGILVDRQGPKIRLGRLATGRVEWDTGGVVRITVEPVPESRHSVSTTYAGPATDAKPGDRLLVDDSRLGLQVLDVEGPGRGV